MKPFTMVLLMAMFMLVSGCGAQNPAGAGNDAVEEETEGLSESNLPRLYDFWAEWCPPCRELKPIVEEIKEEYAGVVDVIFVNVDEEGDTAQEFEIRVIPTLVFVDAEGSELERITGLVTKEKIVERFEEHRFIE